MIKTGNGASLRKSVFTVFPLAAAFSSPFHPRSSQATLFRPLSFPLSGARACDPSLTGSRRLCVLQAFTPPPNLPHKHNNKPFLPCSISTSAP